MQIAATHSQAAPATSLTRRIDNPSLPMRLAIAFAASLLVAAAAHVSFPLPWTPVPLTLGDLAVVLVGLVLGPATGAMALLMYLAEGAAGAPVFNPGGPGGLLQILGFTGGYLMAYPLAAAAAGAIARLRRGHYVAALAGAAAASTIILMGGVLWLSVAHHLTLAHALMAGVVPFLPGQAVKIAVAAGLATTLHRARRA